MRLTGAGTVGSEGSVDLPLFWRSLTPHFFSLTAILNPSSLITKHLFSLLLQKKTISANDAKQYADCLTTHLQAMRYEKKF